MPLLSRRASGSQSERAGCRLIEGDVLDALALLSDGSVDCTVTSPPYFGLRDYGHSAQGGREGSLGAYLDWMSVVLAELLRVTKGSGVLWLNVGDSYANDSKWGGRTGGEHAKGLHGTDVGRMKKTTGVRAKNLMGIPWRLAFAAQDVGWNLRQDVVWDKTCCMPDPAKDRCSRSHEYVFLLSKEPVYFFDHERIKEPSKGVSGGGFSKKSHDARLKAGQYRAARPADTGLKNRRSVWHIAARGYKGHPAAFPEELASLCCKAGCPPGGTVLDPFCGSGTALVAGLSAGAASVVGIDLEPRYLEVATRRVLAAGHPVRRD